MPERLRIGRHYYYQTWKFKRSFAWKRCLEYWKHSCAVCGRQAGSGFMIVADHWHPFRRGENVLTPDNAIPLCHAMKGFTGGCNGLKGSRDPERWLIEFLGEDKAREKLSEIAAYFQWAEQQVDPPKLSETLKQAEQRTGIDASTFRHWIDEGKLAATKPGRDWLAKPEDVDEAIRVNGAKPRKPHKKRRHGKIEGESEG